MVSLWGSKNGEEQQDAGEGENHGDESRQSHRQSGGPEPDERTRLLPPRNDGFLEPDDPAVSTRAALMLKPYLTNSSGFTIQSLERQGASLFQRHFPCHQLPVVGLTPCVHLR